MTLVINLKDFDEYFDLALMPDGRKLYEMPQYFVCSKCGYAVGGQLKHDPDRLEINDCKCTKEKHEDQA